MKKNMDPRITEKNMGLSKYVALFFILLFVCGSYTGIYFLQKQSDDNVIYLVLSMLTYIVVISLLMTLAFARFRKHYLQIPIDCLSEAARKVADGDYSVRISPLRKDDKKDEFEVLFEDFNTMTEELASTEMLKKDFVANVSHELKTPLAVIRNYATILQIAGLTDVERQEYSKKIGDASIRLSVLVTNILQINRLENQKIVKGSNPFNLSEQLSRCALGFEQIWEEKEIEFEADFDQNILLNSNEELLDIVWNNLISNALKFTEAGGSVHISAKQINGFVVVSIKDTGCGIDEVQIRHIFDKFYQADTSHATKGNGLGLALVKRIVVLLGGRIRVDSISGAESTFTIELKL